MRSAWFLVVLFASVVPLAQAAALPLPSGASMVDPEYGWSTFVYDEAMDVAQGFMVERAASEPSPVEQVRFAAPTDGGVGHLYDSTSGCCVAPNGARGGLFTIRGSSHGAPTVEVFDPVAATFEKIRFLE